MKTFIDTIEFNVPLVTDYNKVFWMIDSDHIQSCCESHYLDFDSSEQEFELVSSMLSKIDKIEIYWEEGMGITLYFYEWIKRVGIFIPWRWYNNGYYGDNLELIITTPNNWTYQYDISEYQDILG